MATGLYSGVSGLALGVGLNKGVTGLWSGASGLITGWGGGFNPLSLFAAGEPGAWYDPSDLSTMFQDTAGTTPVTATGQTVGLLLDKSQGLVLGSELVTNSWTRGFLSVDGTILVSGPSVTITQGAGDGSGFRWVQPITCVVGRSYRLSLSNATKVGGTLAIAAISSNSSGTGITADNSINDGQVPGQKFVVATATTMYVVISLSGGSTGNSATFTGLSVKELPGNHATQATAASRPIYGIEPFGGRRNLLTYTEQFDNAAWAKVGSNAVANSTTAPDSTTTADTLRLNAGATVTTSAFGLFTAGVLSYWSQPTASALSAGTHTASIYVKAASGLTHVQLRVALSANLTTSPSGLCLVRLSDGAVIDSTGGLGTVQDAGNGWWRISIPFTATAAIHHVGCWFWNSTSISSAAGTEGYFVWGAQLETGSTATPYQRVTDQWNVTQAGVPSVSYIQCDGTDDFLLTGTITPGTDKAQVFAGVRKLSDAAQGMLVETSANAGSNNGAFFISAPNNAGVGNYAVLARGSSSAFYLPATYSAPITNVVTALFDTGGATIADQITPRLNGVVDRDAPSGVTGTGNFLAYPLYIGRRAGTTLPFNGRIYQMLVRFGANLSAATITQTENYTAGKTGFFAPQITGVPTII